MTGTATLSWSRPPSWASTNTKSPSPSSAPSLPGPAATATTYLSVPASADPCLHSRYIDWRIMHFFNAILQSEHPLAAEVPRSVTTPHHGRCSVTFVERPALYRPRSVSICAERHHPAHIGRTRCRSRLLDIVAQSPVPQIVPCAYCLAARTAHKRPIHPVPAFGQRPSVGGQARRGLARSLASVDNTAVASLGRVSKFGADKWRTTGVRLARVYGVSGGTAGEDDVPCQPWIRLECSTRIPFVHFAFSW